MGPLDRLVKKVKPAGRSVEKRGKVGSGGAREGSGVSTDDAVMELLKLAADDSPDGLFITSWDGVGVFANDQFRTLFNIPRQGSKGAVDRILSGIENSLDIKGKSTKTLEGLRKTGREGHVGAGELIVRGKDAKPHWRRLSVTPFGLASGAHRYCLWRGQDITDEKRQQTAKQSADMRRVDLLERMPAGFFSVDSKGRIIYANQQLADWLGVARQDLRGRNFSDFVVSAAATDTEGAPLRSGEAADHGEVVLRSQDGFEFTASLVQSTRRTSDGDFFYSRSLVVRGVTADCPELQDENDPLGPARRFRSLFDDAPVGIVLLDVRGNVLDCNHAFQSLSRAHREKMVGRPFAERLAPENRDQVNQLLSKVVMGVSRTARMDISIPLRAEKTVMAALFAGRMEDGAGEVTGLILHFIDTTEYKSLKLQVSQSQKMQALGQLSGGVAHDFNNLLTAMIGFTDLLLERHGPGDPSFNDLQQVRQNANRATNLVRQLLAFSRKQNLEPETLDIRDCLGDLANLLRRLLGEKVKLRIEHARDVGLIRADRGQFDQVIINLAVNARDAMPDGGPLVIKTSNKDVTTALNEGGEVIQPGRYVLIEVIDRGAGIPKDVLARIFEPFFSTKEVGQGTGLGLSTAYGIIHQSGGFVSVESESGEGTTFRVYLPKLAEFETARRGTREGGDVQEELELPMFEVDLTGEETILLVEDEDAVRMFGARALRNKGYKVLEAGDGEMALDQIGSGGKGIDLIVSDVIMPGMDGHSLAKKARELMPGVPIILMSGYAEDAFQDKIDQDESIHFLPKPFTLKTLAGKVKAVLGEAGEEPGAASAGEPPPGGR